MIRTKASAFSLVEILVALIFVSFAFLPIYNLFRFGQLGTTSNINEVAATNYASDLVNFVRDLPYYKIANAAGNRDRLIMENDQQINTFFQGINLRPPPPVEAPFVRILELHRFRGRDSRLFGFMDWLTRRRSVANYMVRVRVEYPKAHGGPLDDVTLFSIVME